MFSKLREYKHFLDKSLLKGFVKGLTVTFVAAVLCFYLKITLLQFLLVGISFVLLLYVFVCLQLGFIHKITKTRDIDTSYTSIGVSLFSLFSSGLFLLTTNLTIYEVLPCIIILIFNLYLLYLKYLEAQTIFHEHEAKKNLPTTDGYISGGEDYVSVDFMPFLPDPANKEFFELQVEVHKIINKQSNNTELSDQDYAKIVKFCQSAIELHPLQLQSLVLTKKGIYRYYFKDVEQAEAFLRKNQPSN